MAMASDPIMSTYVWRGGRVFRVSTINRDSSAALAPGLRYAETMVWEREDPPSGCTRDGRLVGQSEGPENSVEVHFRMCRALRERGSLEGVDVG